MMYLRLVGVALLLVVAVGVPAADAALGPFAPANPFTAANGAATMHGDAGSSDASPYPGPRPGPQRVTVNVLGAACPAVLQGADRVPIALCTAIADRRPTVYALDPSTGAPTATLALAAGNLFGGVYAYLDQDDRLVLFDARGALVRVGHHRRPGGRMTLSVDDAIPAAPAIERRCPQVCGGVVGLAPDWRGRVWFATAQGVAGFVDPRTRTVQTVALGAGEQVANSISTSPGGTAIATDQALYLLTAAHDGRARIVWRAPYDRGPARKPGQLSRGTGATPTFFGPEDGTRYLAITDNATPAEHLLVYDTRARASVAKPKGRRGARARRAPRKVPRVVCDIPVLTPGPSGTENSPVGSGRSVFVASTYGYPYPAAPPGAEPTQPRSAPFAGGLTRVDLAPGGRGCAVRWQSALRSAAVPRLDVPQGLLYTVARTNPLSPGATGALDAYDAVAIDADTGVVIHRQPIGATAALDTLQLAPTIVPGHVMYQGTITGITRIAG